MGDGIKVKWRRIPKDIDRRKKRTWLWGNIQTVRRDTVHSSRCSAYRARSSFLSFPRYLRPARLRGPPMCVLSAISLTPEIYLMEAPPLPKGGLLHPISSHFRILFFAPFFFILKVRFSFQTIWMGQLDCVISLHFKPFQSSKYEILNGGKGKIVDVSIFKM